jgi:hypothetical protein
MRNCPQTAGRIAWILLVLLVAVNFAAVQTESAMELHAHHHGGPNDHCCAGCHGGHFPVLNNASSLALSGLTVANWRAIIDVAQPASSDNRTFNPSRAPPA